MTAPKYGNYFELEGCFPPDIPGAMKKACAEIRECVPRELIHRTVFRIIPPNILYDEVGYLCWKVIKTDEAMPEKRFEIKHKERLDFLFGRPDTTNYYWRLTKKGV